jgi:hypothetical protein
VTQTALLLLVIIVWVRFTEHHENYVQSWVGPDQTRIRAVIDELHRVNPTLRHASSVVFLDDPFESWEMSFITRLWFSDHDLRVWLNRKTPLSQPDLATMEYIFTFDGPRLVQLKPLVVQP